MRMRALAEAAAAKEQAEHESLIAEKENEIKQRKAEEKRRQQVRAQHKKDVAIMPANKRVAVVNAKLKAIQESIIEEELKDPIVLPDMDITECQERTMTWVNSGYPSNDIHSSTPKGASTLNDGRISNGEEHAPVKGYTPGEGHTTARVYTPGEEHAPVKGYTPGEGHTPVKGYTPGEGHTPTKRYTPGEEHTPAKGHIPGERYTPVRGHTPRKGHLPANMNIPGGTSPGWWTHPCRRIHFRRREQLSHSSYSKSHS